MISPTWITPTFVTVAIQSVLEERTAADLRFILHVQQNKQHQRQCFDRRLRYCHGPEQMPLPGVWLQGSLLLLTLIFQLSFLAWPWPSPITTTLPGNGDWELPPPSALDPGWGWRDRPQLAGPCPVSLGTPDCAPHPSWLLLHPDNQAKSLYMFASQCLKKTCLSFACSHSFQVVLFTGICSTSKDYSREYYIHVLKKGNKQYFYSHFPEVQAKNSVVGGRTQYLHKHPT